jgi:hypothetical protein
MCKSCCKGNIGNSLFYPTPHSFEPKVLLGGSLVRPRVKTCRLELGSYLCKRASSVVADGHLAAMDQPVDVVHPEANAFHMERANRETQSCALFKKRVARRIVRLRLHARDQRLQAVVGGFPVIRVGRHGELSFCL